MFRKQALAAGRPFLSAVKGSRTDQLLERLKEKEVQEGLKDADYILFTIGGNDLMKVVRQNFAHLTLTPPSVRESPTAAITISRLGETDVFSTPAFHSVQAESRQTRAIMTVINRMFKNDAPSF